MQRQKLTLPDRMGKEVVEEGMEERGKGEEEEGKERRGNIYMYVHLELGQINLDF